MSEHQDDRPLSPCVDQTKNEISAYYRDAPIGAPAVVRHTQHGMLRYLVRIIGDRNTRSGNISTKQDGSFSMKDGRNRFHPKGQTTLVVPTDAVVAWAEENPMGCIGVSIYRPGSHRL